MNLTKEDIKERNIFLHNSTRFIYFKLSDLKDINILTGNIRFTINNVIYDFNKNDNNIFVNGQEILINNDFLKNIYKILSKNE